MKTNGSKRNPLIVIITTVFIDLLGFSIVIPILAPLLALPNISPILPNTPFDQRLIIFGFLISSYAIAQFIGAPIIGQLSDRYGRKKLLAVSLIGTLIARVIFIIGILNNDIYLLFAARILDGLTGGNISVAQSAIADISTPENKAKNFGLIGAAFGLGFIIGPYLGGKLGEVATINWAAGFLPGWIATTATLPLWFATLLCLINIVLLFTIFPETLKQKLVKPFNILAPIKNLINVVKIANLKVLIITIFLTTLGFTFFTQYLSVYIQNKFTNDIQTSVDQKVSNGELKIVIPDQIQQIAVPAVRQQTIDGFTTKIKQGFFEAEAQSKSSDFFSYIGLWVVIAQGFLARILLKKYNSEQLLKVGLIVNSAAAFLFLIPASISALYLVVPFFALSNGLISPNLNFLISGSADAKAQGEILGMNQSVSSLGQAIPPVVSGYTGSVSVNAPILISASTTFLAWLVFMLFYKRNSKQIVHEE
jgi:DHA1 family tetracycline resistance protein-like MFS transporter